MSSIVWLSPKDSVHHYGLELMTSDKATAENFMYNEIPDLCQELNCKYFIQGREITDRNSWVYFEFFGEGSEEKIIDLIIEFNKLFGDAYYSGEVLFEEPSTEFLKELGVW